VRYLTWVNIPPGKFIKNKNFSIVANSRQGTEGNKASGVKENKARNKWKKE